jgi:hypothetical protein
MQFIARGIDAVEQEISNKITNRTLCPFIRKPFENCFCVSTNSLFSEATIHYCGGHFEKCEIYEKNAGVREHEA